METLYRKVSVRERLPLKSGFYFTFSNSGTKKTNWFMSEKFSYISPSYTPEWWLEELPDTTTQLKADKAELLEALEDIVNYGGIANFDTLKSLIQKHKQ